MSSASLSILASSALLFMIFRSHKKLTTPLHRLLFGLSISDIFSSVAMVFSSILSPADHIGWNPIGNMTLCRIQGFFFLIGHVASPIYNCSLCVYYLIEIKYTHLREHMNKIEPLLHMLPIILGLFFATTFLLLDGIQPYATSCFPAYRYPYECEFNPDMECEDRLREFIILFIIYMFLLFLVVPVTIFVSMLSIYLEVASQERRSNRYRFSFTRRGSSSARRNREAARNRAAAYSLAWFLTWAMYFVIVFHMSVFSRNHDGFAMPIPLVWLHVALYPLQGLFNFIVYILPRLIEKLSYHEQQNVAHPKRFFLALRDSLTSRGRIPGCTSTGSLRRGQSSLYRQSRAQARRRSTMRHGRNKENTISDQPFEENCGHNSNDCRGDEKIVNDESLHHTNDNSADNIEHTNDLLGDNRDEDSFTLQST